MPAKKLIAVPLRLDGVNPQVAQDPKLIDAGSLGGRQRLPLRFSRPGGHQFLDPGGHAFP